MKRAALTAAVLSIPLSALAQQSAIAPLLQKDLPDIEGKQVTMITVEMPPGGSDPPHRHDAHVFVYVLEGEVVMQVAGGPEVRLMPGQTFYEAPSDVHAVGRNASDAAPARFLVFFVNDAGAPLLTPVN